ncbi:MAG: anti-sigma factor [Gallionellales bacterium RIFCSPLOWO2_12_FULL_59_22]|nr:MAG: anti-sigma factor [Gallionellales bacterium RIFCSPLOWO2_02_FULL_59_110]OGT04586.1 MAG: anti-sigma factor [Gallionellales bacterium RIFCSPLOWO2_02_58_13]OGT11205.1 MAG: anti-sigma factor [Gallionellales bacterium RIFCSPLOWO2_12_FULL_59_22]
MKTEISALMDGELFEDETEGLLDRVKRDTAAHKDWEVYHLIGDVLRQPEYIHCDLSAKVRECMRNEPTVLAPRGHAMKRKIRAIALSAAASVSAIGIVAWMSLQVGSEAMPQIAMQQPGARPASAQIQPKSNDYLMAHQEFSPSTDMSGGASYIRTAAYSSDKK